MICNKPKKTTILPGYWRKLELSIVRKKKKILLL
jgi:hypothetical protein